MVSVAINRMKKDPSKELVVNLHPTLLPLAESAGLDPELLEVALETNDRGDIRVQDKHPIPVSGGERLIFSGPEFEALIGALERSTRKWALRPVSHNDTAYLRKMTGDFPD